MTVFTLKESGLQFLQRIVLAFLVVSFASGCASIANSPRHGVDILSEPSDAAYIIRNENGKVVANGSTPDRVVLRSTASGVTAAKYKVQFNHPNHAPVTKKLNATFSPWYFANIISPSTLIGLLVIDPFTGTMYHLPDSVETNFLYPGEPVIK